MEILKFGDNPSPNRSNNNQRKPAAMIVAGVLVAMMGMSTTLAGTITINTNGAVEFGQGLVTTAACDSTINVTPSSTFSTANDTFTVSKLTLSDIGSGCYGKDLKITAYDSAGNALKWTTGGTAGGFVNFLIPSDSATANAGSFSFASASTSYTAGLTFADYANWGSSSTSNGTIAIASMGMPNSVTRITIESSGSNA